jgi:DNA-binding beta-propeller fold protein YncE
VAFSKDGMLASADADGNVRLMNPATGRPLGAPLLAGSGDDLTGVAFSPSGSLLAGTDEDGYVRLWRPATGRPVGRPLPADPGGGVNGVAFSPDGGLLASADGNGYVRLWRPATGRPVGRPLPADPNLKFGGVSGVAFSPSGGLLASADENGYVRLWNPVTGRPVGRPLPADPGGGVTGVAFSPDGGLLASADENGYVRLWNPVTGRPVGRPLPADPGGGVNGVAFSPGGRLLASADEDGYVRLWNPRSGSPIGDPLPAGPDAGGPNASGVSGISFGPGGSVLASASGDGTVQPWALWQVTAPYAALCADVGPPAKADWAHYAPDESQPHTCVGYATPSGISARVPRASGQVTQLSGSAPQRRQAADQLSALLAQSTLDRGSINNAYNDVMSCGPTLAQDAATFQEAVVSRQSLVRSLASMPGANLLPVSLIQSLTQAWSASISADQDYAEWAGDESANCTPNDSDSNLAAAAAPDDQATQDKATFVSQWNPIATRYGLPTYAQDQF